MNDTADWTSSSGSSDSGEASAVAEVATPETNSAAVAVAPAANLRPRAFVSKSAFVSLSSESSSESEGHDVAVAEDAQPEVQGGEPLTLALPSEAPAEVSNAEGKGTE